MAWSFQVRRYIYILTLLFWILVFATIYSLKNENSYNYSNHELARYLSHMIIGCIVRELPRQCVRCVGPESEGSSTGKIRKRKLMLRAHSPYRLCALVRYQHPDGEKLPSFHVAVSELFPLESRVT